MTRNAPATSANPPHRMVRILPCEPNTGGSPPATLSVHGPQHRECAERERASIRARRLDAYCAATVSILAHGARGVRADGSMSIERAAWPLDPTAYRHL